MPRVERFGDTALRFELEGAVDRGMLNEALRAISGVTDVVFAEATAAVYFAAGLDLRGRVAELLRAPQAAEHVAVDREPIVMDVVYDGPDLTRVARWAGMSEEEVVRVHSARVYRVIYLGFLPGFAYLGDVDPRIAAPRLPSPRPRVPAGALGIAGARTGVYPSVSPGGWNLIGRVSVPVFDLARGALFRAGDLVRFRPVVAG